MLLNLRMLPNLLAVFSRGQRQVPRHLSTKMEGLIGSSSAHHIEGFHPRANLSPCKQPEFDVQPHFIKCLDQRSPHHLSSLAVNAPHLHVMSQRMLPVSGSLSSAEDDWLRCYPCADRFVSSFISDCSCSTNSHFRLSEYNSVLFLLHHEGSGKRSVQAGSRCGDRENQVRKMGFLTIG